MKRTLLGGLCLLLAAVPLRAQSDTRKATVAYLRKLQADDGGFRADTRATRSDLPATTAAFRALKYFGGAPHDREACAAFVRKCFDKESGGFAARPGGKARYRPTAVGITGGAVCAVLRLGGKVEHPDNVLRALNAGQRKDGGFGKADGEGSDLETCYRIARAFHMLKSKPQGADRLRDFITRCRNDDGGYGVAPGQPSNVSGCYYAGIILHWLKPD